MEATNQPQLIQNYEVVRVMGEGSFGKVFLIRNVNSQAELAMKKYSYYHLKKNGKDLSLQRSVKILQSLNHKCILKFVDYIITKQDSIYLFFEPCKKGSLEKIKPLLVKSKQRMLIKFVLFQLIEGLKYLKSVSVAHRDIKPSNIAFTNEGQLKIIDFDEAVCFNPAYIKDQSSKLPQFPDISECPIYVSRRSRAMSYVGTQIYMSPQMKSRTQSDERGDIWALGCIIYEILVNDSLFIDFDDEKQLAQQLSARMSQMRKLQIEEEYIILLEKILTINPNERITIQQIYDYPLFAELKNDCSHYEYCRKKFKKLLRGNHTLPNPKTLYDALSVDLIGMKAGQENFEKLKTAVMIANKQQSYDMMYLIGGGQYFKLRDIMDDTKKRYIFYDEIETIKIVDNFIVISVVVESWSHSAEKKNQEIYLKHIYEEQQMLGKLYDLMLHVFND